jgi:hypothetical protein
VRETIAALPPPAAQPIGQQPMAALPEALREELSRLARQGQAAVLRERLRQARAALPQHAEALGVLQLCADRFDFQSMAQHLREFDTETDPDTEKETDHEPD